jgi:hypothetical protein
LGSSGTASWQMYLDCRSNTGQIISGCIDIT